MWHHPCCAPMPGQWFAPPGWVFYPVYVPLACCPPPQPPCEDECEELTVPQQIEASLGAKGAALAGGREDSYLTLEYLVEAGAADTRVTVTAQQPDGTSSTWTDGGAGTGFHAHEAFLAVAPGTRLTLEVADAKVTARLRWCETICC